MTEVLYVLGYLGSGKTTFVKNYLARHPGRNAVLVNDFGAEDVDGLILEHRAVKVESIFNGSVFCTCRSEMFVDAMLRLAEENYDRIIVETSGLSNPFQMRKLFSFFNERSGNVYHFAGAVCVVDAVRFEKVLHSLNAVEMQVAAADVILINKTDLVGKTDCERVERTIRNLNADAPVHFTVDAVLPDENFEVKERTLPPFIEDIAVRKLKVEFGQVLSDEELETIGKNLAPLCHRIKGVVQRESGYSIYEYADGVGSFAETDATGNFLILLSAERIAFHDKVQAVLESTGVVFTLC